jgi:putative glycosyltransferase (TIGR04372 family)
MLRRPIVYVNFSPLADMHTFRKDFLCITKKHFVKVSQKFLTLREIFSHGCGFFRTTSEYDSKGLMLIENTSEEIRDVVLEMSDRLNGTWEPHEDDQELQRKFWEIFPGEAVDRGGVPLHGEIRSRYGASFLRENRWWLE